MKKPYVLFKQIFGSRIVLSIIFFSLLVLATTTMPTLVKQYLHDIAAKTTIIKDKQSDSNGSPLCVETAVEHKCSQQASISTEPSANPTPTPTAVPVSSTQKQTDTRPMITYATANTYCDNQDNNAMPVYNKISDATSESVKSTVQALLNNAWNNHAPVPTTAINDIYTRANTTITNAWQTYLQMTKGCPVSLIPPDPIPYPLLSNQ